MTLKEKISEAHAVAKQIQKDYPQITNLWFEYYDVPTSEIEQLVNEGGGTMRVDKRMGKDVLTFQMRHQLHFSVFAYSKPIKLTSPIYVAEDGTEYHPD